MVGIPDVSVGVLGVLVKVLGVLFGILDVFGIGVVYLLHLVFGKGYLAFSSHKKCGFLFINTKLPLQKAAHFCLLCAKNQLFNHNHHHHHHPYQYFHINIIVTPTSIIIIIHHHHHPHQHYHLKGLKAAYKHKEARSTLNKNHLRWI